MDLTAGALLFDLDGVLVDSTESVERHWRMFAEWFDLDGDDLIIKSRGVPHVDTIKQELAGRSENEIAKALRRFEQLEVEDATLDKPLSGVLEILDGLPSFGWAVVTSCWRELAIARANASGIELPDALVTADQLARGKPAPDGYLRAAKLVGVPAGECMVFEDAPSGIRAALSAGASVIALRTTTPDPQLLNALPNTGRIIINDLRDVVITFAAGRFKITSAPPVKSLETT